jgi:hypothetical protein
MRADGLRPARISAGQRRQLELLALLASNAAGEISERELAQLLEVTPAFLETMAHSSYCRTAYRGTIGTGYVAWSITDQGRARLGELEQMPGARQ